MIKAISRPLAQLKTEYTVVVVGSGYGAGVAASRMARAGQSVCVLERGRELLPGQYPNDLASASAQMQADTSRGRIGSPYAMFNVHVNPDMMALVGCGLGGTSLINANVALEMDPRLFTYKPRQWPKEFRDDPDALKAHVEQARSMLDAKAYPSTFPALGKLQALESSAKVMKQPFYRPPICVNFEDKVNPFGVPQVACTLCGDCCSGCNDGAKNTTLMNYLPDANNHGAEIFCQARVSHVAREGNLWRVFFMGPAADPADTTSQEAPLSVKAAIVVLGAGSLGSTEILLRSRDKGLTLSAQLGQRFSGNGDVLGFGYNNHWPSDAQGAHSNPGYTNLNGVGRGSNSDITPLPQPGPCITGIIDMRNARQVQDGLVIEEGVIPGAMATAIPAAAFMADALFGNFLQYGPAQAGARLLEAQSEGDAILNQPSAMTAMAYAGPAARTQTYLVMSVDDAAGTLALRDGRLRIDWPGAGRAPLIARDNEFLKQASSAIHGNFIPNPIWTEAQGYKLVTVHPVGGCGMGDDASLGVVNHKCQVFFGSEGNAVHEGLYVCDGAAMPGAVGVNPLLTITAIAERTCALLAAERGWSIDYKLDAAKPLPKAPAAGPEQRSLLERIEDSLKSGALDVAKQALHAIIDKHPDQLSPSFEFTETMHGFVSTHAGGSPAPARERISDDYELATAWGRSQGNPLSFRLCVHSDNLHQLTADPLHPAQITGTVTCPALSDQPMIVSDGRFHLLPVDADRVETWRMTYDMVLTRTDHGGTPLTFHGFKVLHQRSGSHWWDDVTTLFITVRDGGADGPLCAQGILKLNLEDLMWQGASVKMELHHDGALANIISQFPQAVSAIKMLYMAKFAGFFGGVLFQSYGGMLSDMNNFPAKPGGRAPARPLRAPAPVAVTLPLLPLDQGFSIKLTRYQGGDRGPVILAPGFTVKASSFAIDTVETNLVEFLCANHYDVWLFDYRASPDSGSPIKPFNIDDIASVDWPAAVKHVLDITGAPGVQVMAHCVGSMSLLMALLKGMSGVRSVISSALTLNPVTNWLSYLKVDLDVVRLMEASSLFEHGFNVIPGQPGVDTMFDHTVDVVAWNIPVPEGEQCKNPVCRRIFSIFGPSYTHAQLNEATHNAMMDMFGLIAIPPFEQLALIMQREQVVDAQGGDSYCRPEQLARLALPISFITGALNQIFDPETIARTQQWLSRVNGPQHYDMHVFEDYAHMDMFIGRNAARDVFPHLLDRLLQHALACSA